MDMQGSSLLAIDPTACLCAQDNIIFNSNTIVTNNATLTTQIRMQAMKAKGQQINHINVAKMNNSA